MSNRKALLGKKLGMSQVWDENGFFVPVTLVDVSTNVVTAVKTEESDGYKAVQLGYGRWLATLLRPVSPRVATSSRCAPTTSISSRPARNWPLTCSKRVLRST